MAPFFFSINIAWGKFQERDASFRLMLNRKASLRMVCSAQHHQITIFKQQIRGVGRTFHRGEGEAFLRQFLSRATNQASFVRTLLLHTSVFHVRNLTARNYRIISCYCE